MKALLPTVLYFEITGGEPFLIKEQFELLQFAVDCGEAHHIELHYNTNGSTWPADAPEIWKHFKALRVAFSIDNIGERFEYERKNGRWATTLETLRKMHEFRDTYNAEYDIEITTQICLTVNVQNVYYLEEICDWVNTQPFDSYYFNMLHGQAEMKISTRLPRLRGLARLACA